VDRPDVGQFRRQPVGDLARTVLTAVVHDDNLEVVGDLADRRQRRAGRPLDIGLLVVARKEDRQTDRLARTFHERPLANCPDNGPDGPLLSAERGPCNMERLDEHMWL